MFSEGTERDKPHEMCWQYFQLLLLISYLLILT